MHVLLEIGCNAGHLFSRRSHGALIQGMNPLFHPCPQGVEKVVATVSSVNIVALLDLIQDLLRSLLADHAFQFTMRKRPDYGKEVTA